MISKAIERQKIFVKILKRYFQIFSFPAFFTVLFSSHRKEMNSSEVEQMRYFENVVDCRTFPPFDSFLSLPTAEELEMVDSQEYEPDIVRETASYKSDSAKFIIKKKTFENQYCNVYTQRINTLKPIIRERVNELWNPSGVFFWKLIFQIPFPSWTSSWILLKTRIVLSLEHFSKRCR